MKLNKEAKDKLRHGNSLKQGIKPRKTICKACPHAYDIRNVSCHIGDLEMFCLDEPHICHAERDGLCRGVVEKMLMHDMTWNLEGEKS